MDNIYYFHNFLTKLKMDNSERYYIGCDGDVELYI